MLQLQDYVYESLQGKPVDTIRLATLLPGTEDEKINCTIDLIRQSHQPQYSALSYVWGSTHSRQDLSHIILNGRLLSVTSNLHSFLQYLRHAKVALQVWADAICINQGDDAERGHQVGLMGDIYRNAQMVYSWLGEDSQDLDTIWPERRYWPRISMSLFNRQRSIVPILRHGRPPRLTEERAEKVLHKTQPWEALLSLCNHTYWTRVWIVQEVLLARCMTLCAGHRKVRWEDFEALVAAFSRAELMGPMRSDKKFVYGVEDLGFNVNGAKSMAFFRTLDHYSNFNAVKSSIRTSDALKIVKSRITKERRSLQTLLAQHRGQQCLVPRDRIYALLALADDGEKIQPDYTQAALAVFCDAASIVRTESVLLSALEIIPYDISLQIAKLGIRYTWDSRVSDYRLSSIRGAELSWSKIRELHPVLFEL